MAKPGNWDDLSRRLISGAAMALVGIVMVWLGPPWFNALAALVSGVMVWELARMVAPRQPFVAKQMAVAGAIVVLVASYLPAQVALPAIGAVALLGVTQIAAHRIITLVFTLAILGAGLGLAWFRQEYGIVWIVWLIVVVIATDVCGYFAGRLIGGPKFWPSISPKKTWSGTVAGWVAAALIGVLFRQFTNAGVDLPWISVALSLSSQMGDIAESAVKRRMGVKDSSSLIPGHGGLFDRFDGLLAGALFMLFVSQLVYVPEVRM